MKTTNPKTAMILSVENLSFSYGHHEILSDVNLSISAGERWAIIGKNGVGKSTLIQCLACLLAPTSGRILLQGEPIGTYTSRERAKQIAYVPQATGRFVPAYTVYDYVLMGRFAYHGLLASPTGFDKSIVDNALGLTDTAMLKERRMDTLSGGELQRVFLAGAVAQQTAILLLDEPVAFLDPLHQEQVHQALNRVHDEYGSTIVTVTHDVNSALHFFGHIAALKDGRLFFNGSADELVKKSPQILTDIYGIGFCRACEQPQQEWFVVAREAAREE